jgi:acyl-CoA synthetase (AMP-forming)/AMP-acid ligase II
MVTTFLEAVEEGRTTFVELESSTTIAPSEFLRGIASLRPIVRDAGVRPGERVMIAVANGALFPALLSAILRAEANPLLVHHQTPAHELLRLGSAYGATVAFADASGCHGWTDELVGQRFSTLPWVDGGWARIEGVATPSASFGDASLHPTSGTTGHPKVAIRTAEHLLGDVRHYVETMALDRSEVYLASIPMSHVYGFGFCVGVPLVNGGTVVSMRRFNPELAVRAIRDRGVTVYPSSPAALDLMLSEQLTPGGTGCTITSAGAPLPQRTREAVKDRWGLDVRPLYGTTETGAITVARAEDRLEEASSVGHPMHGVDLEIRDDERSATDTDTDTGAGRIWVRSDAVMAGYLDDAGIDRSRLSEGWYDTGDLGTMDDDGRLLLRGRVSEVINVYGLKVIPTEVEDVIRLMPGVEDVKVYTGVDATDTQQVKAAIVSSEVSVREVQMHCARHLAPFKRPSAIAMLDALPRTPSGKVSMPDLP